VLTDRIPGFAICSHCAGHRPLAACEGCGLLACRDCRGAGQCITCYRERRARLRRAQRQKRLTEAARNAALFACIATSGVAAVAAAMLPDSALCVSGTPHAVQVARGRVRLVGQAVQHFVEVTGGTCPASLGTLRRAGFLAAPAIDPWGEPLLYGCVDTPSAFVVLSTGPDQIPGTDDDLLYSSR